MSSKRLLLFFLLISIFITGYSGIRYVNPPIMVAVGCGIDDVYEAELHTSDTTRFAVIGDFGSGDKNAAAVAEMVNSWNPEFIISLGDTNYPYGEASTIQSSFAPYLPYVDSQQFYSAIGNHDLMTEGGKAYYDYLDLPNNERFYTFTQGSIQFFALNSNGSELAGITSESEQAGWLQSELAKSTAEFQVVFLHHPPYSSGFHGSTTELQWDFSEWGVDAVLAGHEHNYERITHDNIPYIVNGLGGARIRPFRSFAIDGSESQYNCTHGAMLVEATDHAVTFNFISVENKLIDTVTIQAADNTETS